MKTWSLVSEPFILKARTNLSHLICEPPSIFSVLGNYLQDLTK